MAGFFGAALPGIAQGINGAQQYQTNQINQQLNQAQLQQALRKMALDQQNQQAQKQAIQAMAKANPNGPGGTYSPQQIAQFTQNPQAFGDLMSQLKPTITGGYNLAGRGITGQYGLERSQQTGQNQANVADIKGQNALDVQNARNTGNTDVQKLRNTGATDVQGMRNTGNANVATIRNQRPTTAAAASATNTPEYKTAKSEYDQAKQDERAIERNYMMNPGAAYNDPQWLDARKRSMTAQQKMESMQSKAAVQTAAGGPPKVTSDADYNKLPSGTQFVDPEGNLRTKP